MTEPTSRRPNLAASLTLLSCAALVVWGSFAALIVDTLELSGGTVLENRVTMWGETVLENGRVVEDRSETILIGIAAAIAAVLLVAAAVAVLSRANARALTGLAAGWTAGATAFVGTVVLNATDGESAATTGLGMWLLLVATVLAVAVAIALTVRDLGTPGVHPWADRAPGAAPLAVAAVIVVVASFLALITSTTTRDGGDFEVSLTLWGQRVNGTARSSDLVHWGLPVTIAAGLLLVGAAILFFSDRNPERRRGGMIGRLTGSVGAGMLGGLVTAVVVIILDELFTNQDNGVNIGSGTFLLAAAVILAVLGAIRGGRPVADPESDSVAP